MRVKIIPLFILCVVPAVAQAATTFDKWWEHDEVCQIDDTRCYNTYDGIDTEEWDASAGCRGLKYICPNALTTNVSDRVTKTRAQIASGTDIKVDFDINTYVSNDDCYGARRTRNNGATVSVGGQYVRVWCNGILDNPAAETLPNGEFTTGPQPTCRELAEYNIAGILNGNCYGRTYDTTLYAIDCNGESPVLIVLNGANYDPNARGLTAADATSTFNSMISTSATKRGIYFNRQVLKK